MAAIDLKALVGRLNEPCRRALEAAAGLTLSRTHYNVEIEHWLLKLADAADGDIAAILRHYEVDQARFTVDLNRALDRMKTGNARAPSLSPEIVDLAKRGLADGLRRARPVAGALRSSAVGVAGRRDAGAPGARSLGPAAAHPGRCAEARLRRGDRWQQRSGERDELAGGCAGNRRRSERDQPDPARSRSSRSTSQRWRAPGRSIRSSAATAKSAKSSTS